jgi:hypothetical protein
MKDGELANQVGTHWTYEANWKNLSLNPRGSWRVSHQASFLRSQQFHFIVFDVSNFMLLSFIVFCVWWQVPRKWVSLSWGSFLSKVMLLSTCTKGEPVLFLGPEIAKTWEWFSILVKFCFEKQRQQISHFPSFFREGVTKGLYTGYCFNGGVQKVSSIELKSIWTCSSLLLHCRESEHPMILVCNYIVIKLWVSKVQRLCISLVS